MSDLSIRGIETALSHHSRAVLQDNWEVGNGATTTVIPVTLANPGGKAVDVTGQVAAELTGATVEFISGLNLGASRNVLSATSAGTLTLDTALATAPAQGDRFVLMRAVRLEVTAPENLTQVGSQNVPVDDSGLARVPVTDFATEVNNATVAAGAIRFVASGDERAYNTYTINGTMRVNGSLLTQSLSIGSGGKLILGSGATVTAGAFN